MQKKKKEKDKTLEVVPYDFYKIMDNYYCLN